MDSVSLEAHLLQLCNAVGGYEVDVETQQESYVLGDEAIGKKLGVLVSANLGCRLLKGYKTIIAFG
jgi:hypothetical protein